MRLQNRAVQYAPHDLDGATKARLAAGGAMRDFLGAVRPRYELALQQNEVLDIFEDEFANLADDEGGAGSSKSNSAITVRGWRGMTGRLERFVGSHFAFWE